MWCPELQLCGHPRDFRVRCPSPIKSMPSEGSPEEELEEKAEGKEPPGGKGKKRAELKSKPVAETKPPAAEGKKAEADKGFHGAWLERNDCYDSKFRISK